jgi:hypothetical protein
MKIPPGRPHGTQAGFIFTRHPLSLQPPIHSQTLIHSMSLLLILIILLIIGGGGYGFRSGNHYVGGGASLLVIILIALLLTGRI